MNVEPRFTLRLAGQDASCWTLASARVTIGRESVWEQSSAATMTVRLRSNAATGPDGSLALDTLAELDADGWRLFAGRVTDVSADPDPDTRGLWETTLVAAGTLAELSRFKIGDEPWPEEPEADRLQRIITLAGYDPSGVLPLSGPDMRAVDIDAQTPAALLRAVADSGGGLLWEDHAASDAVTGGARIAYQPLSLRTVASVTLWDQVADPWDAVADAWDSAQVGSPAAPWLIDPCWVSASDWRWTSRIGDLVTLARVEYGTGETRPRVTAGDTTPPVYEKSITSELAHQIDAQSLADRVIFGRGAPRWSTESALVDVTRIPDASRADLPSLLVGGRAVVVPDMIPGSPVREFVGFVEGWEHEIQIDAGAPAWWIKLFITDASMTAPMTRWDQVAVSWDAVDPADVWDQLLVTGI